MLRIRISKEEFNLITLGKNRRLYRKIDVRGRSSVLFRKITNPPEIIQLIGYKGNRSTIDIELLSASVVNGLTEINLGKIIKIVKADDPPPIIQCKRCGEDFEGQRKNGRYCPKCKKERRAKQMAEWRKNNPTHIKKYKKNAAKKEKEKEQKYDHEYQPQKRAPHPCAKCRKITTNWMLCEECFAWAVNPSTVEMSYSTYS